MITFVKTDFSRDWRKFLEIFLMLFESRMKGFYYDL